MSAISLTTAATLFAGPGKASNSTPSINTLSAQHAPKDGPIEGLLFVPSLNSHDPCNNITAPFIPANVTRHQDVTSFGYHTIGLAPWLTPNCSQSFLDAARRAGSEALMFFLPASDDTKPPPPADSTWLLHGESSWESENMYPVYAIPGPAGIALMKQLSWYSNNRTLPQDQSNEFVALSESESWRVLLFSVIDLGLDGSDSHTSHLGSGSCDSRGRADVVEGAATERMEAEKEDAEAEAHMTKYGSYVKAEETTDAEQGPKTANAESGNTPLQPCPYRPFSPTTAYSGFCCPRHIKRLSHPQTICAICLDDFIPASSTVRELPCGHIYHPECIDMSLTQSSSLCPLCKKSVLEPGCFPISIPDAVYERVSMRESHHRSNQ
ncbi:hypothetical protein AN0441.2 [Aspergillus nidulans FGSC A4]|nr:hypothetical protein AN0441.2 [Aspergillus nidulans FGSC A4]|eukprot:XP_658045.1 hypothetical protein AN0441.2 [Aspergillus nidulans FGSC A4]